MEEVELNPISRNIGSVPKTLKQNYFYESIVDEFIVSSVSIWNTIFRYNSYNFSSTVYQRNLKLFKTIFSTRFDKHLLLKFPHTRYTCHARRFHRRRGRRRRPCSIDSKAFPRDVSTLSTAPVDLAALLVDV